jgi:hypothetical protein
MVGALKNAEPDQGHQRFIEPAAVNAADRCENIATGGPTNDGGSQCNIFGDARPIQAGHQALFKRGWDQPTRGNSEVRLALAVKEDAGDLLNKQRHAVGSFRDPANEVFEEAAAEESLHDLRDVFSVQTPQSHRGVYPRVPLGWHFSAGSEYKQQASIVQFVEQELKQLG